ncbi:MAG: amino acid ABC transporter ATP-binding protein, partial [Phascolarctobacterium sp.]|nr:amino acid ABC transporter ATP-binding protein [Phascolarctobacterium sp.]
MTKEMIQITDLQKYYGNLHVLKGVNLTIAEQEVLVIIGPSGCGKSTLLRCMNFLEEPTSGTVTIDGVVLKNDDSINDVRKEVGMVFQRFNLFPHMTVMENLMLAPMKVRGVDKAEAEATAKIYLEKV